VPTSIDFGRETSRKPVDWLVVLPVGCGLSRFAAEND
jgi:hypothetical protein